MTRPGPRFVTALWLLAAGALLVPLLPWVPWLLLAGAAAAVGATVVEHLRLRGLRVGHEEAARHVLSLDEEEPIEFRLSTNATRPVRLEIRRTWPDLLARPASTLRARCRPGESLALSVPVRAVARGSAPVAGPHVAMTFSGWAERIVPVPHAGELCVMPNLRAVRRLHHKLNDAILRGMGQRTAPHLGKGREFDRLREYTVDDDFRDIAWKASARHRKLIVREYRLDRSQDVLVCLDRGHRMAARTTRIRRIDHAANAAVLVSYICNRMEDRFGILSFGASVDLGVGQGRGAGHLRKVTGYAAGINADYVHTDYAALGAHVKRRLRQRSLVLIITALPEGGEEGAVVRAARMLLPKHLPVVIVLSDPALRAAAETLPSGKEELCRTLVARDLWTKRRVMMEELRRLGAWVVDTGPQDAGVDAVNAYLEIKRRQLL